MVSLHRSVAVVSLFALVGGCSSGNDGLSANEGDLTGESSSVNYCSYDPQRTDGENPLGMRAFVTLETTPEGTLAQYEQLPSNTGSLVNLEGTFSQSRRLTFHDQSIAQAREQLERNPKLYAELVGFDETFDEMNKVLSCERLDLEGREGIADAEGPVPACSFEPNTGEANPLGMRAFITIDSDEEAVYFVYEQFDSIVQAEPAVTVSVYRSLALMNVSVEAARKAVSDPESALAADLLGEDDAASAAELYAEVDATLTCK